MTARFGTPGSVDPIRMAALPDAMRREGSLMLLDMGMSAMAARRHLGLSALAFNRLVNLAPAPFRRGGEASLGGDVE
jgi:hypothetical protein